VGHRGDKYIELERSRRLGVTAAELVQQVDWPPIESA
jgi:hypothetical protein